MLSLSEYCQKSGRAGRSNMPKSTKERGEARQNVFAHLRPKGADSPSLPRVAGAHVHQRAVNRRRLRTKVGILSQRARIGALVLGVAHAKTLALHHTYDGPPSNQTQLCAGGRPPNQPQRRPRRSLCNDRHVGSGRRRQTGTNAGQIPCDGFRPSASMLAERCKKSTYRHL